MLHSIDTILPVAAEVSGLNLYWAVFKGNGDAQTCYWDKWLFVPVCLLSVEMMLIKHVWAKILYFMFLGIYKHNISELTVNMEKTFMPAIW